MASSEGIATDAESGDESGPGDDTTKPPTDDETGRVRAVSGCCSAIIEQVSVGGVGWLECTECGEVVVL